LADERSKALTVSNQAIFHVDVATATNSPEASSNRDSRKAMLLPRFRNFPVQVALFALKGRIY